MDPASSPDETVFPRVSIITVVYNDRDLLADTIESVLAQTYPYIEYLIVDGASTDGTVDVIRQYEDRITGWSSEPDKGLYDAMNKGLARTTGEYVWFLNAGDLIYDNDTLEQVIAHADGADCLYGQAALLDETGNIVGLRKHKRLPKQLTWKHMRLGMVVSHQALIVARDIAPEYHTGYRIAADIDWTIRVLRKAKRVRNTGQILCKFLLGGLSSKHWQRSLLERFRILTRHFGLPLTVVSHLQIVAEKIAGKPPVSRLLTPNRD